MMMERRTFLKITGVAGIVAAHRAPAFAQGSKLHLLRWNDFIPACDVTLRQQLLPEATKARGAEIRLETINANDLQPRITAAVQSGNGADIIMSLHNWPHLYKNAMADVTDLAEWQAKEQGGYYPQSEQAVKDGPRYLALPWSISGLQIAYRRSWFAEVGQTTWPKTLDELRQVGVKLKQAFWKDACDEGALAWDDTNNNRAFLSGEISATLNGASIYIAAKRGQDKIKDE